MAGAVKLGTVLVREGVITPQQLDEALRIQVLYGGRLGTNLVDLGYVDPDRMADWLGRVTGFPVATEEMCAHVSDEALALISSEMAERFECFPLRKDGRRLHLAMVNPGDLAATDALSFKTGLRIVPYVIPELRLYGHLEKRYAIERKLRYIRLTAKEEKKPAAPPPPPMPGLPPLPSPAPVASTPPAPRPPSAPPPASYNPFAAAPGRQPTPPTTPRVQPLPTPPTPALPGLPPVPPPPPPRPSASPPTPNFAGSHAPTVPSLSPVTPPAPGTSVAVTRPEVRPVSMPPAPAPSAPPPPRPVSAPPAPGLRPPASSQAMTAPSVPRVSVPPPTSSALATPRVDVGLPPGGVASAPPLPAAMSLPDAISALEHAPTRDEVADIVLRFALGQLDTAMLFLVRDGMALGWKGRGGRVDPAVVELIMLPLNAPSMFQDATESKHPHAGQVTDAVLHKHFYKALRREAPQSVVVVPVLMRDRVVNLIYGDRLERHDAAVASAGLVELSRHIGGAYERILRESKKRQS